MSTPEKRQQSLRNGNGNGIVHFMNGSCDNINGNKYYTEQERSIKFLEKHKLLLLG